MTIRHLDHAKGEPCSVCDEPTGPWWFKGEPHVAYDGRVYCPHCSMPLGMDMGKAKDRAVAHRRDTCDGWKAATQGRVAVEAEQADTW